MKKNKNMRPDGSRPQKKDDPAQYSLDEILEEARRLRETSGILPPAPDEDFPLSPEEKERLDALYSPEKAGSAATDDPAAAPLEEVPASPEDAPGAGDDPPDEERDIPSDPEGEDGSESARSLDDGGAPEETTASSRPSKKNSLFRSLREKWERRREEPLFPKDLPDYSKYPMLSSVPRRTEDEAPDFSYLFGEELEEADDEVFDLHFEEIREARRKRVEQASSLAGVQQEDLFSITRTIDIERPGDTIAFRLDRKDRDQTIETPPVEDGAEKADSTAIAAETSESAAETAEKALPALSLIHI